MLAKSIDADPSGKKATEIDFQTSLPFQSVCHV